MLDILCTSADIPEMINDPFNMQNYPFNMYYDTSQVSERVGLILTPLGGWRWSGATTKPSTAELTCDFSLHSEKHVNLATVCHICSWLVG